MALKGNYFRKYQREGISVFSATHTAQILFSLSLGVYKGNPYI